MFVVGGESLIDLVSEPKGPDGLIRLTAHAGGSPYNCAIALANLGNKTGFLCPISKDNFGDYLLGPLATAGVAPLIEQRVNQPTTLALVTLDTKGAASYEFFRGADRAFSANTLLDALPQKPGAFQIGGFCAIVPEDAKAWMAVAREAAARGAIISMDPNVRPTLVDDFFAYKSRLADFFALANIIKLSSEDLEAIDPSLSIPEHAAALLARPECKLVIVTLGEKGSHAFTAAANAEAKSYRPPVFGDTVGAGDSLMAGVLSLLDARGWLTKAHLSRLGEAELAEMLNYGAIVAGLNCGQKGCRPPSRAEVEAVLQKR